MKAQRGTSREGQRQTMTVHGDDSTHPGASSPPLVFRHARHVELPTPAVVRSHAAVPPYRRSSDTRRDLGEPFTMFVITRSGAKEPCRFDKITDRITSLAYGLHELVEPVRARAPPPRPGGAAAATCAGTAGSVRGCGRAQRALSAASTPGDLPPTLCRCWLRRRSPPASTRASPPPSWTSWLRRRRRA